VGYIYQWTFHNGVKDTGRVATYRLPATGTYTVHLDLVDTICNAVYGYDFTSAVTRMDQRLWIPNAFTPNGDGINDQVHVTFDLFSVNGGKLTVGAYDLAGHRIATLLEQPALAGPYKATWNGRDTSGRTVPPGVYLLRVEVEVDKGVFSQIGHTGVAY
jgi:hypothetical protein